MLFRSVERAYGRTYFDVRPQDVAASGLPAFRTRGGWKNYVLGVAGTYSLTGDLLHGWKVIAGGTYKRMLNDFGDTPIVSIAGSRDTSRSSVAKLPSASRRNRAFCQYIAGT